MSSEDTTFCVRKLGQRVASEGVNATALRSLFETQHSQCMALLANPDPNNNPNYREDNEDGRARRGDGDYGT